MRHTHLNKFNFKHLILGISALIFAVLTLLVAFISSLVAFNEMSDGLYQQGIQLTRGLAEDSIAPLLFDSPEGAEGILDTLVNVHQVTEVSIVRASDEILIKRQVTKHVSKKYPVVSPSVPFNVIETPDGWYFSVLVTTKQSAEQSSIEFFELDMEYADVALGYVNLSVSKNSIYNSRQNIFIRNFLASTGVAFVLLFVMYLVLRNVTRPLEKLSLLMEQGQHGQYHENTDFRGPKEIFEISHAYNNMIYAIREREQNLSLTLDSIGDAVIVTDAKGNIVRMNPVAEQLTNWSLTEARGHSVKSVFPIIDAATREPIENPVEKVMAGGETIYLSNHTTLISRDGTEYQIADSAAPIRNGEGHILGMVLVFNDVTEKYRLKLDIDKQLARFKELSNLALTLTGNPQDVFNNISEMVSRLLDVKVACLLEVRDDELYFLSVYANGKAYSNAGHCDLSITPFSTVESDKDGRICHQVAELFPEASFLKEHKSFSYCGFPALDSDGNVLAVICLLDDKPHEFTEDDQNLLRIIGQRIGLELEHSHIQDKLQKKEEQLRLSQKMDALGKLTGGVAHDYNNMLGIILGYSDLLENLVSDKPQLMKYVHEILHAGERGAKLTKKLLAFSRQRTTDAEKLNLNTLLQNEQDMLEKTLTARIKLVFDLDKNLWPVYLDAGDLEDAIVNLSINAMHAIEANGQLTIRTSKQRVEGDDVNLLQLDPGEYVLLSIIDTGCGMDKATKEKIFEPFFSTKGDKGTGLGLTQVYGFVERSGGSMKVYSEPGHGTQFVIYFPRYHESNNDDKSEEKNNAVDFSGDETILVVDDEPALLDLTREILGQHGYKVLCAESAKQALEILKHEAIDLLLTDVIMPEIDGYQLAAVVQEKYPDIKIQLASGYTDNRHIEMVDDSLNQNLLPKPYHSQTLLKRMRELFDKKR